MKPILTVFAVAVTILSNKLTADLHYAAWFRGDNGGFGQIDQVTPHTKLSTNGIRAITGNENFLYYTDTTDDSLKEYSFESGLTQTLATSEAYSEEIVYNSGSIFYIKSNRLYRFDLELRASEQVATPVTFEDGLGQEQTYYMGSIAADDEHIYWTESVQITKLSFISHAIYRLNLTSGLKETIFSSTTTPISGGIDVVGSEIITARRNPSHPFDQTIIAIDIQSGSISEIVNFFGYIADIEASESNIFWPSHTSGNIPSGTVYVYDFATNTTQPIFGITTTVYDLHLDNQNRDETEVAISTDEVASMINFDGVLQKSYDLNTWIDVTEISPQPFGKNEGKAFFRSRSKY